MIISEQKPQITTVGWGQEQSFAIGNLGRILKILRNNMYANPIKAICREISCNARDAHREIGTPDSPIEIHLPNKWDNSLRIKDYGPGISPDRMAEIFIQYGKSTKNEDNIQTGGFGLGAKTPFAYSDQFQITTISSDQIKRIYIAYIDETEAGKMRLVSEKSTNEDTGTEISLCVLDKDFIKFKEAVSEVCAYWKVKPIITGKIGQNWVWNNSNKEAVLSGENWEIYSRYNYNYENYVIIDGIKYSIRLENLLYDKKINLSNTNMLLYFDVGELSLSANREELQYDDITNKCIQSRIDKIYNELSSLTEKKLSSYDSYLDALIEYKKVLKSLNIKELNVKWNNIELKSKIDLQDTIHLCFLKNKYYHHHGSSYTISTKKIDSISIDISYKILFIVNDIKGKSIYRERIKKFLIDNGHTDYTTVYIIPNKDKLGHIPIEYLNAIKLSQLPKTTTNSPNKIIKCFKFDRGVWLGDTAPKNGIYVILTGKTRTISSNGKSVSEYYFKDIVNQLKIDVYGFRSNIEGKLLKNNWIPFDGYITDYLNTELQTKNLTIKDVCSIRNNYNKLNNIEFNISLFNKNSIYAKYISETKRIQEEYFKLEGLWNIIKFLGKEIYTEEDEYSKLKTEVDNKYPLLQYVYDSPSEHIIKYINLIDTQEETKHGKL